MQKADLEQVNLILSKSFNHARIQQGYRSGHVPVCKRTFLEMYLDANPDGSFVLEKRGRILAYGFTRLWGRIGWLGPLSVLPAHEDKGYGKQIVRASVAYLQERGATTIGLEMAAASSRNIGFYSRLDFTPEKLTLDLVRKVDKPSRSRPPGEFSLLRFGEMGEDRRERCVAQWREVADRLEPGLDYTREIELARRFGFGDAAVVSVSDRPVAFVLAHTETYSEQEERKFLKVNVLQLLPERPVSDLDLVLEALQQWAREERLPGLYLRVPTRYQAAHEFLSASGFTVVQNDLRMTLKGYPQMDSPECVNLSKWE
ncbi:MAG: GNAT family N-acetyltransferase [Calditrichaeota bacterium]|nr:MAG: GNAT family N-acetyltransferase [Calditrichota bacterium]